MPEVSVVITVYNGKEYICDAVSSAINQTFKDLEVIVMDDASTDETQEVVEKEFKDYLGNKLVYHKNKRNMERVYGRNEGVRMAKGDFIFFLDYDDKWEPDYIEKTLPYLEEYDIVYSFPRTFINRDGSIIRKSKKKIPEDIKEIIFSSMIGLPTCTGVRKESFSGYKDRYILREDWEFFLRSFLSGKKIKVVDNDKTLIREHGGRTSRNVNFMKSTLKVYQDYINRVPEEYLPFFEFHVGELCLRFGNFPLGWKLVLSAFFKKPSLLSDKRKILSILKRGIRVDRFIKYILSEKN